MHFLAQSIEQSIDLTTMSGSDRTRRRTLALLSQILVWNGEPGEAATIFRSGRSSEIRTERYEHGGASTDHQSLDEAKSQEEPGRIALQLDFPKGDPGAALPSTPRTLPTLRVDHSSLHCQSHSKTSLLMHKFCLEGLRERQKCEICQHEIRLIHKDPLIIFTLIRQTALRSEKRL
jgi:hypothetical protein